MSTSDPDATPFFENRVRPYYGNRIRIRPKHPQIRICSPGTERTIDIYFVNFVKFIDNIVVSFSLIQENKKKICYCTIKSYTEICFDIFNDSVGLRVACLCIQAFMVILSIDFYSLKESLCHAIFITINILPFRRIILYSRG